MFFEVIKVSFVGYEDCEGVVLVEWCIRNKFGKVDCVFVFNFKSGIFCKFKCKFV